MYLVDANVLIEAQNRYYAFDIAPGFWAWLDHAHQRSVACSIDVVCDELLAGEDELAAWARDNPTFFRRIDQGTTRHFRDLTSWTTSRSFTQAAPGEVQQDREAHWDGAIRSGWIRPGLPVRRGRRARCLRGTRSR